MGFTREQLQEYVGSTVPDLIGPRPRLMFVGINPGLWTAAVQTHFAHPGNRFYPALLQAGIISEPIDPAAGMSVQDRQRFVARGLAITNISHYATAKASQLSKQQLLEGAARLRHTVREHHPRVVAIAGITAYRTAFGEPKAQLGEQPEALEGAYLWVVPNPSGLNAHETVATLAMAYAEPARRAGIIA